MSVSDTPEPPLHMGILSTANIGRHFAAGLKGSTSVALVAIASRDLPKAEGFAERNGIGRALGSYEALLDDPEIEAVYNPLPNTLHAEWTIRALDAGKHVLCEKPIAVTAGDARAMYAAAKRNGRQLVEAFPYRSQPQTLALKALMRSRELGAPRIVQACFGFPMFDATNIRLNPELGGGALLDAGTYPVSLVHMLAGESPTRITASARWADSGVDSAVVANLEFPSGLLAQVACAFGTGLFRRAVVACDDGVAITDYLNHTTEQAAGLLQISRGGWEPRHETVQFEPVNGFRAEAESFAAAVRGDPAAWNGISEAESVAVMQTLEAIIESARRGSAVDL